MPGRKFCQFDRLTFQKHLAVDYRVGAIGKNLMTWGSTRSAL